MQRVARCIIKSTHNQAKVLDDITHKAKNLYNYANYQMRQHFFITGKMLTAYTLIPQLRKENQVDFRALPSAVSAQVIIQLEKSWKAYFSSLKLFKKEPTKFKGRPRLPRYKEKDGNFIVIYPQLTIKNNIFVPIKQKNQQTNLKPMKLPPHLKDSTIKQVRIVPQSACFIVEFIYEAEAKEQVITELDSWLSIDFGLSNFITALDNQGNSPFIIKGGVIKSHNQFYNKTRARLKSIAELSNHRKTTHQLQKIDRMRYTWMENFIHHTSSYIRDYCVEHRISQVIVGNNLFWKQNIQLGKRTNQNFVSIPYYNLTRKLRYKLNEVGIELIETDESYTSKIDHLAYEPMCHQKKYLGKRIKRGLFKSSTGTLLNADVNGCIGIARKVFGDAVIRQIIDSGVGMTPSKRNVLNHSHFEFEKVS